MPRSSIYWFAAMALALSMMPQAGPAADTDEFKIKRQEVFEFTAKPAVKRDGDKVTITFASKALCDVTVAIEDGRRQTSRVPIGGDKVGLFDARYVAVHSDRRLFIADIGNARIVSVRLDYHATERVSLKGE